MSLFGSYSAIVRDSRMVTIIGRVAGVRGLAVEVADFVVPVGSPCVIWHGAGSVKARVIGFRDDRAMVMPLGTLSGIARGDTVVCDGGEPTIGVGRGMLGRVFNAFGEPIDGRGDFPCEARRELYPDTIDPMSRVRINEPVGSGVRVIDSMLTVGRGQRMGIFAGPGVGKSVLMGMISRYTSADVIVIALVGERGREVRDFIEKDLGEEGMKKAVLVVATGDEPPLVRVQAGAAGTAVAEYFRDEGCDVLLLMDSLTRLAMAQRQVGLVAGEPPTAKGYTPSVFNILPELLERSGRTERGSITGFYTVLVEGDDMSDPIADAVRSITDGHIWLSRQLAGRGHYPAVDVLESISRLMLDITDATHRAAATELKRLMSIYNDIADLVNIGAYARGANPETDWAVAAAPVIMDFFKQDISQPCSYAQAKLGLVELVRDLEKMKNNNARSGSAPGTVGTMR